MSFFAIFVNNLFSACGYVADKIGRLCSGKSKDDEVVKPISERKCALSNGVGPHNGNVLVYGSVFKWLIINIHYVVIMCDKSLFNLMNTFMQTTMSHWIWHWQCNHYVSMSPWPTYIQTLGLKLKFIQFILHWLFTYNIYGMYTGNNRPVEKHPTADEDLIMSLR